MFRIIKNNLIKKHKYPPLGRWNIKDDNGRKADLATHDSCDGDLCAYPKILKNNKNINNNKIVIKKTYDDNIFINSIPGCFDLYYYSYI